MSFALQFVESCAKGGVPPSGQQREARDIDRRGAARSLRQFPLRAPARVSTEQGGGEFLASIQAFSASVMRLIPTTNSCQPRSCEVRTLRPWACQTIITAAALSALFDPAST